MKRLNHLLCFFKHRRVWHPFSWNYPLGSFYCGRCKRWVPLGVLSLDEEANLSVIKEG